MPEFYERMKTRLRTPAEGADTAVWLAVAKSAREGRSGRFYQDRRPVGEHLPLARSGAKEGDEDRLMAVLDEYYAKFSS